ncbi:heptaprenyl diphosphate synthase component 1 [Neobacillus fumarioli]|uniref:heptaprenyl diphosphate synthase component 1 n=1 Tax=Neobacillus fumarioli TaxID=105229 RepID=UPI0008337E35|nr:heptaprenyl diphosphate synthase component 1 [Neobacillus fumarioli]
MQNIRQKFIDMKEKLEKRVFDTYLLEYIERPMIDEDKLLILISMMDTLDLPSKEFENYCLATMLIQIALDTHEHINKLTEDSKARQLTVLAGDYYSGLYYKLLAETENVLIIRALSAGVKEINEHKIIVYHHDSETIENLMTSLKYIESSILMKLSEHFHAEHWSELLANLLFFKRLQKEKDQFLEGESSVLFDSLKRLIFPTSARLTGSLVKHKQQLLAVCDQYLQHSKQTLETLMLESHFLNDFLKARISLLLKHHQPFAKTFAEEG